jgi:hypothetical protein
VSATGCYLIGSMILFVGTIVTNGPTFLIVASGMFTLGSIVAFVKDVRT